MSGGGPSSSTTVEQHFPTWAMGSNPPSYLVGGKGDTTSYDSSAGLPSEVGTGMIPMYLAAALKIAAGNMHQYTSSDADATGALVPSSPFAAGFLSAYTGSVSNPPAKAWISATGGSLPLTQIALVPKQGLVIAITAVDGVTGAITAPGATPAAPFAGGASYAPLDVVSILGGNNDATATVDTVDGSGAVLTCHITNAGTHYLVANDSTAVVGGAGSITYGGYGYVPGMMIAIGTPGVDGLGRLGDQAYGVVQGGVSGTGSVTGGTVVVASAVWMSIVSSHLALTASGGSGYVLGNPATLLLGGQVIQASVTGISGGGSGPGALAQITIPPPGKNSFSVTAGTWTVIGPVNPPPVTSTSLVKLQIINGGSLYPNTSTLHSLTPAEPGETLVEYSNLAVTDPSVPDGITHDPCKSGYANLTQYERNAMVAMAQLAQNGDPLATQGLLLMNAILDGVYLQGVDPLGGTLPLLGFQDVAISTVVGGAQRQFQNRILNKLSPMAQTMATDANTSSRLGARVSATLYDDNFRNERAYQNASVQLAIKYGELEYLLAEAWRTAGVWNRAYITGRLDDNLHVVLADDMIQYNALQILGSAAGTMFGMAKVVTQPLQKPNGWLSAAGGSIAGLAIGAALAPFTGGMSLVAAAELGAAAGGLLGGASAASNGGQF
jgi:hypothetical protein